MLLSSLSSLNAPPNPTHAALLLSVPSDPPSIVLKTSTNVLSFSSFKSLFAHSTSAGAPSKQSSINTNRKSTTRFRMSLRWTSCVTPQKHKTAVFHVKSHFAWRKSATKFLCVITVSDKFVRHSFAYLSVYKWMMGNVPFYTRICRILSQPLQNTDFQSIFACNASAT